MQVSIGGADAYHGKCGFANRNGPRDAQRQRGVFGRFNPGRAQALGSPKPTRRGIAIVSYPFGFVAAR